MKFMVMPMQTRTVPPELMSTLVEVTAEWMGWAKKSGKFDCIYCISGQPGGIGIVNVNSLEELNDVVSGYPMTPFCEVGVYPLSDIDQAMSALREQVKKMGSLRR